MKKSFVVSLIVYFTLFLSAFAEVIGGVWNNEFTNSFTQAEATHRPIVLLFGNRDCSFCNKLWDALKGDVFVSWMNEHKCLYVHKQDDIQNVERKDWDKDNLAAAEWIESFAPETRKSDVNQWAWPIVVVSWKKADGTEIHRLFSGKSGGMPVSSGTLEEQFTASLDLLIGDFGSRKVSFGDRLPLIPSEEGVSQAMPFPYDFDGDGLLDLMVGVKLVSGTNEQGKTTYVGKIRLYRNVGTQDKPQYSWLGENLTVNGEELFEDQGTTGGCQGLQAQFGDYNSDGYPDLAVGHLAGELEVYPGTATPGVYGEKVQLLAKGGSQRSYARFFDADGDGDEELYVGFMDGMFKRFDYTVEGGWTSHDIADSQGNLLRLPPQSQTNNRRSTPAFLDIDDDGLVDLVSGSTDGGVYYFPAVGLGSWSTNCILCVAGQMEMERSRLAIDDLDGDGIDDLVIGFNNGEVVWNKGSHGVVFTCNPEKFYVPGVKIAPICVSVKPKKLDLSIKVDSLPQGLKFGLVGGDYYITGTPTAMYKRNVTFTATYKESGKSVTLKREVPFEVTAWPQLELWVDKRSTGSGTMNGGGSYLAGKTVTISATPTGKDVFAGWYCGGEPFAGNSSDYRQQKISVTIPTNAVTKLEALFVRKEDDAAGFQITCAPSEEGYAAGSPIEPLKVVVESLSAPTLTAKGLPKGLALDAATFRIAGTPTQPGRYTVAFSAKNKSGAKAETNVTFTVCNFRDEEIPVEDAYGPFVPGLATNFVLEAAVGCTVSGLPLGFKFDNKTGLVTGTPKKSGTNVVTFVKKANRVLCDRKASSTFVIGPAPVLTVVSDGEGRGTTKGTGAYAANAKVTLKATADKGSVFAGWYDAEGVLLSQAASYAMTMPAYDLKLTACFVTAETDAASVALAVGGVKLEPEEKVQVTNYCGVAVNWPVEASAKSAVTVKASGLPAGVKLVEDKATGKRVIAGAPTAVSKVAKDGVTLMPSTVKVTVTTAGKAAKTYLIDLTVLERPAWSVGTYDGGVSCEVGRGTVTATLAANGKVSGKYLIDSKSYSFAADSLADVMDDGAFGADITIKVDSKVILLDRIVLKPQTYDAAMPEIGGAETADGDNFLVSSNAVQNLWGRKDVAAFKLPVFAKNAEGTLAFSDREFGSCELAFKFGAKGKVTVAGVVGEKKVSASAQLLLDGIGPSPCMCFARSYNGRLVVAIKSIGFCRTFTFSGDYEVDQIGASDIVLETSAQ